MRRFGFGCAPRAAIATAAANAELSRTTALKAPASSQGYPGHCLWRDVLSAGAACHSVQR